MEFKKDEFICSTPLKKPRIQKTFASTRTSRKNCHQEESFEAGKAISLSEIRESTTTVEIELVLCSDQTIGKSFFVEFLLIFFILDIIF